MLVNDIAIADIFINSGNFFKFYTTYVVYIHYVYNNFFQQNNYNEAITTYSKCREKKNFENFNTVLFLQKKKYGLIKKLGVF